MGLREVSFLFYLAFWGQRRRFYEIKFLLRLDWALAVRGDAEPGTLNPEP